MKKGKDRSLKKYLRVPVEGMEVCGSGGAYGMMSGLSNLSFQGRNLGTTVKIWKRMLGDDVTIFLGVAGALVPAGMRKTFLFLIENHLVDCIVSTGANLFHDVHETLGRKHWRGTPLADDEELFRHGVDRIYDTFASEHEFRQTENRIARISCKLQKNYNYSTREYLKFLGTELRKEACRPGILTAAAENDIPVYCPAIADSSIGIALDKARTKWKAKFFIDVIKDVKETGAIMRWCGRSGVIYLGGGTPKNFIQQAALIPSKTMTKFFPHRYAIQITTDAPHWGGLSGCTLEEAKSWGKIGVDADQVTVYCDATIAFPLLVNAIAEELPRMKLGRMPVFHWQPAGAPNPIKIKYIPRA